MTLSGNNTGIEVPPEVIEALGAGRKPPVNVTVNGYAYRSTVAVMGGRYMISFSSDKRAATGIQGGDPITVDLEVDTAPRTVDVPDDLAAALDAAPGAREAFDAARAERAQGARDERRVGEGRRDAGAAHRRDRGQARRLRDAGWQCRRLARQAPMRAGEFGARRGG